MLEIALELKTSFKKNSVNLNHSIPPRVEILTSWTVAFCVTEKTSNLKYAKFDRKHVKFDRKHVKFDRKRIKFN